MIPKEEFFKRLKERYPDRALTDLAESGERVMKSAEKLRGKTLTLSLPLDAGLESAVYYVAGIEDELSKLGVLTCAKDGSFFAPYGLFPDVKHYLALQKQAGRELLRREYFYDLIADRKYDPAGRKISIHETVKTNSDALREVIESCGGEIGSLKEADTAVYLGERFCDTDNTGYRPLYDLILPWIKEDESKTALIFYSATDGLCGPPEEPELAVLSRLAEKRENISFIVLDWHKGRRFFT